MATSARTRRVARELCKFTRRAACVLQISVSILECVESRQQNYYSNYRAARPVYAIKLPFGLARSATDPRKDTFKRTEKYQFQYTGSIVIPRRISKQKKIPSFIHLEMQRENFIEFHCACDVAYIPPRISHAENDALRSIVFSQRVQNSCLGLPRTERQTNCGKITLIYARTRALREATRGNEYKFPTISVEIAKMSLATLINARRSYCTARI